MDYQRLTDANKMGEGDIPDGYNGQTAHVSYHLVDGSLWVKAACGCFRAPASAQPQGLMLKDGTR